MVLIWTGATSGWQSSLALKKDRSQLLLDLAEFPSWAPEFQRAQIPGEMDLYASWQRDIPQRIFFLPLPRSSAPCVALWDGSQKSHVGSFALNGPYLSHKKWWYVLWELWKFKQSQGSVLLHLVVSHQVVLSKITQGLGFEISMLQNLTLRAQSKAPTFSKEISLQSLSKVSGIIFMPLIWQRGARVTVLGFYFLQKIRTWRQGHKLSTLSIIKYFSLGYLSGNWSRHGSILTYYTH